MSVWSMRVAGFIAAGKGSGAERGESSMRLKRTRARARDRRDVFATDHPGVLWRVSAFTQARPPRQVEFEPPICPSVRKFSLATLRASPVDFTLLTCHWPS